MHPGCVWCGTDVRDLPAAGRRHTRIDVKKSCFVLRESRNRCCEDAELIGPVCESRAEGAYGSIREINFLPWQRAPGGSRGAVWPQAGLEPATLASEVGASPCRAVSGRASRCGSGLISGAATCLILRVPLAAGPPAHASGTYACPPERYSCSSRPGLSRRRLSRAAQGQTLRPMGPFVPRAQGVASSRRCALMGEMPLASFPQMLGWYAAMLHLFHPLPSRHLHC